jgi:hypothetical protein
MRRVLLLSLALPLLSWAVLLGQDEAKKPANPDKAPSGPKVGVPVPGPFECLNLNGPAAGRYHCLVCRFNLDPVVMVFAREPAEGKDGPLNELLRQLNEAVEKHSDKRLSAGAIILSPAARSSVTDPGETDPAKLIKEAADREALLAKLGERADKVKNVIVACMPPEGPKGWNISPESDVTVVVYRRLKVLDTFAFAPGQLRDEDAEAILQKVRDRLGVTRPKDNGKKDAPEKKAKDDADK